MSARGRRSGMAAALIESTFACFILLWGESIFRGRHVAGPFFLLRRPQVCCSATQWPLARRILSRLDPANITGETIDSAATSRPALLRVHFAAIDLCAIDHIIVLGSSRAMERDSDERVFF